MSYLRFEKALMTNLEESLGRELIRTNRSGAYSSSTIVDCNTRKYHGLLVVPVPELDDENHVLLSSLDATVIQHGAEFNLGLHKYQGNNYSPKGHKYIREFDCGKVPTTIYRVGGVILKKEVVFQHYEDRILIPAVNHLEDGDDTDSVVPGDRLSAREIEILAGVAQGLLNKEIAAKYNLSIHTVITHRKNIARKTGIKTIAGLTAYAILNNLI